MYIYIFVITLSNTKSSLHVESVPVTDLNKLVNEFWWFCQQIWQDGEIVCIVRWLDVSQQVGVRGRGQPRLTLQHECGDGIGSGRAEGGRSIGEVSHTENAEQHAIAIVGRTRSGEEWGGHELLCVAHGWS